MNCVLCDKPLIKHEEHLGSILDNFSGSKGEVWTYSCKCPLYYFDELIYIRDNEINIRKHLGQRDYEILTAQFRYKKQILDNLHENTDQARSMYNKRKISHKDKKDSDENNECKNNNDVIWGLIYKALDNKQQAQ